MGGEDRDTRAAIEWVEGFLIQARMDGDIDEESYLKLRARLFEARFQQAEGVRVATPAAAVARPTAPMPPLPPMPPIPPVPSKPPVPSAARRPAPAREPVHNPVQHWFDGVRRAVASDIAVNGLAYLGVLLVFGGTLGFLLFSFNTLPRAARPIAELAIPTVLLGSATFLRRRGSPLVATALGLVGGTLLPVVIFAAYADSVPPDLHGPALAVGVTVTSLVLAAAYAAVASRWPDVSVRFLVAPMVWVALWGVGLLQPGWHVSLIDWTAWQFALVAVGVTGTASLVRLRPEARLSRDSQPSLIPGALLSLGLGLLLAGSEGWPWGPVVILGLSSLATSELVASRLDEPMVQLVQPVLLWLTIAGLRNGLGDVVAGMVGVMESLALLEWQARRRPGAIPLVAGVLGIGTGLALTNADPTATAVASGISSAWAHIRRIWPIPGPSAEDIATIAAIALPALFAASLAAALPDGIALIVLATIALTASLSVRMLRPTDVFLRWWTFGAAVAVAIWSASPDVPGWHATVGAALSAAAVAVTTVDAAIRVWPAVAIASWAAWLALGAVGVSSDAASAIIVIAASALTATATWRRGVAEHVAAAAGLAAICWLVTVPRGWLQVGALAAITVAAAAITVAGELGGRGVSDLFARVGEANVRTDLGRVVPPTIFLIALAGLCVATANASGLLSGSPEVLGPLLSALALAEAGSTWFVRTRSPLRTVIGVGAFIVGVAGVVVAASDPTTSALALALLISSVAALALEARWQPMTWVAWGATVALAARLAEIAHLAPQDRALVVAAWSAALLTGGLALDDRRSGRRQVGAFVRTPSFVPVVITGGVSFLPALILALQGSDARIAGVSIGGTMVVMIVAFQVRLGGLSTGSYLLASLAAWTLSPWNPQEDPGVTVAWAAILLSIAFAARSSSPGLAPPWRWDLPAFAVACGVTLFGLARSAEMGELAVTWIGAGALALAITWVLRAPIWGVVSAVLITVGATDAGPLAGSIASAASAVGLAWIAARTPRDQPEGRRALQIAAGISACIVLVEITRLVGWSSTDLAIVAAMLALLATVAASSVWTRRPGSPWVDQAAVLAVAYNGLAAWAAVSAWPNRWPLVVVLLVTATQLGAAAIVLRKGSLLIAVPPLICSAWLVGAEDLLQRSVQWSSVPIGLAILVVVSIGRWDRSRREQPPADPSLIVLEFAGIAATVVPSLVEIVTVSPIHGLASIVLGVALAGWGLVTKVRRRLFVGVGTVVAAVVLMIAGPIARLVPQVEGAVLWVLLVLIGLAMLGVATSLERGRAKIAATLRRVDERLQGWE